MKITPLEIRQKSFEKNFRGYEKDEVHAFLLTLSQEWERMQDENKELRIKLESTEREVQKLREVEGSLYRTLKTAEETGANVVDQAKKSAELQLRESQLQADAIIQEARTRARNTIEESDMRAREIVADMEDRMKLLVENFKKLETTREDLLLDLKRLGSELLDKVERARQNNRDFDPDKHLAAVKREAKKIIHPNLEFETPKAPPREQPKAEMKVPVASEPEFQPEPVEVAEAGPKKVQKSFFDDIN